MWHGYEHRAHRYVELIITMFLLLGTTAIAGLHVPGTKVICIEMDEEILELAKNRVEKFKENKKFILPEAYPIFAMCKLIPNKGALEIAVGLTQEESASVDENSGNDNEDGESDSQNVEMGDEEVSVLDLLQCRLKLRPPAGNLYRNGFLETLDGALTEALSTGKLEIRQSAIPGAGYGLFAKQNIAKGQLLLHYWGDIYAVPEEEVLALVSALKSVRMVETKKYIMKSGKKLG